MHVHEFVDTDNNIIDLQKPAILKAALLIVIKKKKKEDLFKFLVEIVKE